VSQPPGIGLRAGAYEHVAEGLTQQRCVVLDGGVATELPHQHRQDDERTWGIEALASTPEEVLEVHRRYVSAGVDVVTTNTWGLAAALDDEAVVVGANGHPVHWMDIARRGVRVARQAIAAEGRTGECAVAFSLNGDIDRPDGAETVSLLARSLATDPPDLIMLETLSVLRPSLFEVVEALLETSVPLWLSFRRCRHGLCGVYGQHWGGPEGDAFGRAARRFEDLGVSALLVNCIPPDHVGGVMSYLRDFTDLPLGVYPNLGYYTSAGWHFEDGIDGERYADMALRWRSEGAQIVGGCCGTRPEHIEAARTALEGTAPGRERHEEPAHPPEDRDGRGDLPARCWTDRRGHALQPLPVPAIDLHEEVAGSVPGTYLLWRYLHEHGIGAHQRCLDVACGAGLQAVQLARNGAAHVHALDVNGRAVANTLDNAFANGVAERVSGEQADLYPWIPAERYEVIVASLPQTPIDPLGRLGSHRPVDYWGRGLVDQLIAKLPRALAPEGVAYVTTTSLLSPGRTSDLLAEAGLRAESSPGSSLTFPANTSRSGSTSVISSSSATR
jgi:S-methylmethionine-dependent homocysteine/selenocysteine methylase/SAM-dependent methyltransferase